MGINMKGLLALWLRGISVSAVDVSGFLGQGESVAQSNALLNQDLMDLVYADIGSAMVAVRDWGCVECPGGLSVGVDKSFTVVAAMVAKKSGIAHSQCITHGGEKLTAPEVGPG